MNDIADKSKSFHQEIWETLSAIDVSGRVKQKNGLTYLSWAWSWGTLMENYPESTWKYLEERYFKDGTCQVQISVTVRDGDRKASRTMRLAVLNYSNKAIENPSASDISNASMRCLTKCIALFGLAHYIYANEDMPEASKKEKELKKELFSSFMTAIETNDGLLMNEVADKMNDEWWKASYNSFKTDKTKQKRNVDRLISEGMAMFRDCIAEYKEHQDNDDELGMIQLMDDLSPYWQERLMECVK